MNWNQITSGMNKEDRQMLADALAKQFLASMGVANPTSTIEVNKTALTEKTYYPAATRAALPTKKTKGRGRICMTWERKGFKAGWRLVDIKTGAIFKIVDVKASGGGWQFDSWATHDFGGRVRHDCVLPDDVRNRAASITSPSGWGKLVSGNPNMACEPGRWLVIDTNRRMIDHLRDAGISAH